MENTSIIVNIILSILSFILAAISVVTVVLILRQNSKMIEKSTRPTLLFGNSFSSIRVCCFVFSLESLTDF